jgi:hypothetical protein
MSLAVVGIDDPMDVEITLTNGTYTQKKKATVQPDSVTKAFLDVKPSQPTLNLKLPALYFNLFHRLVPWKEIPTTTNCRL